jgi:mRNA interferase RelE/StbE
MYRVALSKEALKYYSRVTVATAARLDKCFTNLETDPLKGSNIKSLKGMARKFRYRVGNMRVIYEVDRVNNIVYVLVILPRGQAYK